MPEWIQMFQGEIVQPESQMTSKCGRPPFFRLKTKEGLTYGRLNDQTGCRP